MRFNINSHERKMPLPPNRENGYRPRKSGIFILNSAILRSLPLAGLILTLSLFISLTSEQNRNQSWSLIQSFVYIELLQQTEYIYREVNEFGNLQERRGTDLLEDAEAYNNGLLVLLKLLTSFITASLLTLAAGSIFRRLSKIAEEKQSEESHMDHLVDAAGLQQLTAANPSITKISLAGITVPDKADTGNIVISGASGSGKTTITRELLTSIRKAGRKAVVYDINGDLISHFYRPGKDIILNPLDSRSASWDIWCECMRRNDYLRIATTLIPDHPEEQDFSAGARIVLARLAEQLNESDVQSPGTSALIQQLKDIELSEINEILEGNEGATILARWQDQASRGIRGVLLSCIEPLSELSNDNYRISLRRWSHNDSDDSWVFVSTHSDEMEVLRPLVTTWLELIAHTFTGLPADHLRRAFYVVDELTSVNQIPSLVHLMLKSKQTGVNTVLGIDTYGKLLSLYGSEEVDALTRATQSWLCLRAADSDSASWGSFQLGTKTQLKRTEVSFQGTSHKQINQHQIIAPIITPTQLSTLPDLHGFLRFSDQFPVAKFHAVAKELPKVAMGYSPRVSLDDPEQEVMDFASDKANSVEESENTAENPEADKEAQPLSI